MAEPGTSRFNALLAGGTTLVAIVASVVNIWLTVRNQAIEDRVKERGLAIQDLEAEIKRGQAELDKSRERTDRYKFVQGLLPDLVGADAQKQILTINVIRLTLTEEEAERLFAGFARSDDAELRKAGQVAIEDIKVERRQKSSSASDLERSGFQNLIAGQYEQALADFAEAEKVYPEYHNVAEIARLLRREQQSLSDPEARERVLRRILAEYSWGMSPELKSRLGERAGAGG